MYQTVNKKNLFRLCLFLLSIYSALVYAKNTDIAHTEIKIDEGYDFETAHKLAIAAECTYSADDGYFSTKGTPRDCLKKDEKNYGSLNGNTDLISWTAKKDKNVHESCGKEIDAYLLIKTGNDVILAIRGTQPPIIYDDPTNFNILKDWLNNTDMGFTDGYHTGFLQSWECIRNSLITGKSKEFLDANLTDNTNFFVTGHSKGGAIAIIAALKLTPSNEYWPWGKVPDMIYTFEAAQPVSVTKAKQYANDENILSRIQRLEYKADIVPLLPPGRALHNPQTDTENALANLFNKLNLLDQGAYDSSSLGTIFYIDKHNNFIKVTDENKAEVYKMQREHIQETFSKALAGESLRSLSFSNLLSLNPRNIKIPICSEIENNHVAHASYLKRIANKSLIQIDEEISHEWDKLCSIGSMFDALKLSILRNVFNISGQIK